MPLVESRDGERLMHARLTQTPEGSVLGVSVSHALTDGFSFFLAKSMWAALARGEAVKAPPMQRLLQAPEPQVAAAMENLDPQTLLEKCGLFWSEPRQPAAALPNQIRIQLSADALADSADSTACARCRAFTCGIRSTVCSSPICRVCRSRSSTSGVERQRRCAWSRSSMAWRR